MPARGRGTTPTTASRLGDDRHAVVDDSLSQRSPLGDSVDVFVRREEAERLIEEVRVDDTELAKLMRIKERELDGGEPN